MLDNDDIDWSCSCAVCGEHVTDLLSPVCYDCRQKMTLVFADDYESLKTRVEKLRWALGRSAARDRALKREIRGLEAAHMDERVKHFDTQQHLSQLQNELAEYHAKPEAFERLRDLLRKERSMRKQESERFIEVCTERDTAQTTLETVCDACEARKTIDNVRDLEAIIKLCELTNE